MLLRGIRSLVVAVLQYSNNQTTESITMYVILKDGQPHEVNSVNDENFFIRIFEELRSNLRPSGLVWTMEQA